jgi:hypothetical protein
MSRCLSVVSTAVVSIVCMSVAAGCIQGNEPNAPPADDPAPQDLTAPQFLTYSQTFTTDQFGTIFLTGPLDISAYKEVDMAIAQFPTNVPNLRAVVQMGEIVPITLSSPAGVFAITTDGTNHVFNVTAPQANVLITGGPPNTAVAIQAWVFLH